MSWNIYILMPEVNEGPTRRGTKLLAQGMVRVVEMPTEISKPTMREAKVECLRLAVETLRERGLQTTVIGFGIRNTYAKKGSGLAWSVTIEQMMRKLVDLRKKGYDLKKLFPRKGEAKAA
jgi:hypothetical protein